MNIKNSDIISDVHNYGANLKTREIFLHNHYEHEGNQGVDYKMGNSFVKNLRMLESLSDKPILVHLYSIGGEWNDCMAMYDSVKTSSSSYITMLSYGQTESASTLILQSADLRILMPNSYFMIHYGTSGYIGQYLNVQNWMNYEKYICDIMMNVYAVRCVDGLYFKEKKYSLEQVKRYLYKKLKDGDWYMKPEEAVYYGFADGVLGSKEYPNISSITC